MALILTDYDLSGGSTNGDSDVPTPNNWRITAYTTGCPDNQWIRVEVYTQGANGGFSVLTDDKGKAIKMDLRGNETKSINPVLVNASVGRVRVHAESIATGTINIDSNNA